MLATWAPADWHEPSLLAFPSCRTQRSVFVSGTGNSQKRHAMSLITSYLTASAATTRSLLRIPCYVKLVTCQNQSQDGVRWSRQAVSQAFIESGSSWDGAEERERERTARVRMRRSHGGIFGVHSNYSWRDTFSAPPGLTKATNWLGKMAKKFMQFYLAAILTPAVRTATLINLVYP